MTALVEVSVNGDNRTFPAGATVEDVVNVLLPSPRGVAVACNGEVITRGAWGSTTLAPADRLEVLTAAQGG